MSSESKKMMSTSNAPPLLGTWSKGKLRKRLMLGHIFMYAVAIILTLGVGVYRITTQWISEREDRLRVLASTASYTIPLDKYDLIAGKVEHIYELKDSEEKNKRTKALFESADYQEILGRLATARKVGKKSIGGVFVARKIDTGLAIIIICEDEEDIGGNIFFPDVQGMTEGFKEPSAGRKPARPTDEKRLGSTGFAPIKKNSTDEESADIVCVSQVKRPVWSVLVNIGWLLLIPVALGFVLSFLMALRMSNIIMNPLKKAAEVIHRMSEGDADAHISPNDQQVTRVLRRSVMDLGATLGKRDRVRAYYGRTLSPGLMESIMITGEERLTRIEKRGISFVKVGIELGASVDPDKDPEAFFEVINAASELAIDAILDNGGSVEDIDGTTVLGVFGSPIAMEGHVSAAVKTALDIRKDFTAALPRRKREGLPKFSLTIWVHTGEALMGIVGTSDRGEYRVIGGPVKEVRSLSRPEKTEGPGPIVTEAVIKAGLPKDIKSRSIGESESAQRVVKLYQVFSL